MNHAEPEVSTGYESAKDNSMYTIGDELADTRSRGSARGQRGRRGRSLPSEPDDFDFAGCQEITPTSVSAALLSRSEAARDYLALVIDDLEQDHHLCAHVLNTLANASDVFPYLTEVKRRCLLTKEFTHILICRAVYLPKHVKVCARGSSEVGTKQAAHMAMIGRLCRELLLLDQPEAL